jgi:hypothetical protein
MKQRPGRTTGHRPAPGGLAVFGVLPDPSDVCLQRLRQAISAGVKPFRIIEEDEVQLS